ncbi:hypothetical protein LZL87_005959 [Fusarium oxysporum]|nr:hypothetical protein LZL87_005959 [Fusarium oxysporum]
MPSRMEFDLDVEGDRFTELNLKIHSLVSSSFGSSEKCPAEVQLKYLATLEEIVSLVAITPYCWRDQVGRSLHQCNILADKLVNLLNEEKLAGEEHYGLGAKSPNRDLSNIEIVSLLPRVDSLMKEGGFAVTSAKIVQNPFTADPATDRDVIKTTKGESVQGTWDWVLQTPELIKWRTSDGTFLWISGGVGSGKTMLAVYLTEQFQLTMASDEILVYYFFDSTLNLRNNAACFVRSLIYQLVQLEKDRKGHRRYPSGTTGFQVLWYIFIGMLQDLRESRILKFDIPGLPIKFVILSRAAPRALEDLMSQYPRIYLDASLQVDALRQYIGASLLALSWAEQLPTDVQNRVKELLQGRSQVSYLWAQLALQSLQRVKASGMVAHLENLPQGLDDLYEWQLSQIETDQREFALQALKWCALSERPMELSQLVEVLPTWADGSLTPEDALRSRLKHCGFLINVSKYSTRFIFLDGGCKAKTIIHGEYETVTMVHRSVYDFLTRVSSPERWYSLHGVAGSHLELATKCLRSMHAASVQDVKPDSRTGFSSFQDYARKCWSYHFERTGEHAIELVKDHPEYFKESPWLNKWFFSLGIAKALLVGVWVLRQLPLVLTILSMFHSITMKILGTTPLHLVAQNGHLSTVKMLLETIPINSLEKKHYTSVFLAGMHGHIEVTELLLQAGADVTSQHPLHRVIWAHDEAMVKMLLGWSPSVSTGTLADATRVPLCVDGERGSMAALLLPAYARQEAKKAVLAKCSFAPAVVLDAAASSTTTLKTMKKLCELAGTDMNRERKEFGLRVARVHGNRAVVRMHIDDYGYSISEANGTQ